METPETEFCTVEVGDGISLQARLFKPTSIKSDIVIVLVHQYSVLGGCQGLMKGIAKALAEKGYRSVTFDMRGVGRSSGKASWTGSAEVQDVVAVCKWASQYIPAGRILLVGCSAGSQAEMKAMEKITY